MYHLYAVRGTSEERVATDRTFEFKSDAMAHAELIEGTMLNWLSDSLTQRGCSAHGYLGRGSLVWEVRQAD